MGVVLQEVPPEIDSVLNMVEAGAISHRLLHIT